MKKFLTLTHKIALAMALSVSYGIAAESDSFRTVKGGMQVKDIQAGNGQAAIAGMVATIHFVGWLDNQGARGKLLFDSRVQGSGDPISFVIGTNRVMPAWNEGVLGMRKGGKRMLLIPPKMAYGNRDINDVIPANAPLQFTIELVGLEE